MRVLLYAGLTLAFCAPVALEPHLRSFASGPDTRLYLWTLGWDLHAMATNPLGIFDANMFYPERRTLAYSEHLIGAAALALPIAPFTDDLLVILNWVLLASTLLTAIGTDRFAREAGASRLGAFLAGSAAAFCSPRLSRLPQAHLATLHWIPFCLLFAARYARSGRPFDLRMAFGFFTLQAVTSGHGGLLLAVALALFGLALAAQRGWGALAQAASAAGIPGALILAVNVPFVWPYYALRDSVGLVRTVEDAAGWSPTPGSFLASGGALHQALTSRIPSLAAAVEAANAILFPGVVLLGLAVLALVRRDPTAAVDPARSSRRLVRGVLTAAAVVGLWLSFGPEAGLYRWAYASIPGFDLIRVPSRFFLLSVTALSVLAALGLDRFRSRSARIAIVLAALAEFWPAPWDAPRDPIATPPIDAWVATQPTPFRVLELPVPRPDLSLRQARFHSEYLLHSAAHWQPIVNGYSSLVPPRHEQLFAELFHFPTESGLSRLEELGVTYVVLHEDMYQPERLAATLTGIERFGDRIRLVRRVGEGRAYRLTRVRD